MILKNDPTRMYELDDFYRSSTTTHNYREKSEIYRLEGDLLERRLFFAPTIFAAAGLIFVANLHDAIGDRIFGYAIISGAFFLGAIMLMFLSSWFYRFGIEERENEHTELGNAQNIMSSTRTSFSRQSETPESEPNQKLIEFQNETVLRSNVHIVEANAYDGNAVTWVNRARFYYCLSCLVIMFASLNLFYAFWSQI